MRTVASVFASLLLIFAALHSAVAADDKKDSPDEPKELTVVDYDSQTHGAVQVKSVSEKTGDFFDVLKDGKRAFPGVEPLLNNTIKLPPGEYIVVVNDTRRKVTIEAGKKTILLPGELVVEGKPDTAFWFPTQGSDQKLAGVQPLFNKSRPLFAGTYRVFAVIRSSDGVIDLGNAEVKPGKKTVIKR